MQSSAPFVAASKVRLLLEPWKTTVSPTRA